MDLRSRLNAYSRRFAEQLFAVYPSWEELAVVEAWPNADSGSFLVEIPSPAAPDQRLWVGTDGGEITVGFGDAGWHEHFGAWTGDDEANSFREALEEVRGILAGTRRVAVGYSKGVASVSQVYDADDGPRLDDVERVEQYSWPAGRIRARAT
ncbi:MAG: hypothetical protein V4813_14840 [Gemmatimonadota bacterium]